MAKNIVSRVDRNLARRLREARRETGLSTRALVKLLPRRLSISHTTLAAYEAGTAVPPIDVLAALADIYKRPLNWFLENRETLSGFRYRNIKPRVPLGEQRQFEATAGKWADAYINLERVLGTRQKRRDSIVDSAEDVSPSALADRVRKSVLSLEDNRPIENVVTVLESFSAWAIEVQANFGIDGAAARRGNEVVVLINPDTANDRIRMNVAHELAHVLYEECRQQVGWTDSETEKRAYLFASSLLLPDSQLEIAFEGESFLRLTQFRERFGVPLASMIYRAEKSRIINTSVSRRLWSEMAHRGWRQSEPGYVWRDRAISFELTLDLAIRTKRLTWDEAERITGIKESELQARLAGLLNSPSRQSSASTTEGASLKFERPTLFDPEINEFS